MTLAERLCLSILNGTSPLAYDKQTVETANIYTGLNFHNIFKKDSFIFKPYGGFEIGLDISPSSDVKLNYVSDPNTVYAKSIDQQESKNLNAKLGFDLTTSKGFLNDVFLSKKSK